MKIQDKKFGELFGSSFPIIGCVHLLPLPGSPGYRGNIEEVFDQAKEEALIFCDHGVNGLIVENFGDIPFFPGNVSPATVSAMTVAIERIRSEVSIPIGVNVLRNDAHAALSIATATGAAFIRVNVHMHAMVTDQGIIEGKSHDTLRLKRQLESDVMIFADVNVKHAYPLTDIDEISWARDLESRGMADALIITGQSTGSPVNINRLRAVKGHVNVPVLIGSGLTPELFPEIQPLADGAIVGSYFKKDGLATNKVSAERVKAFMDLLK